MLPYGACIRYNRRVRVLPLFTDLTHAHAGSRVFAACRDAVRGALATRHLVDVAREIDAPAEVLAALGVPVDLLPAFPGWRQGDRTFAPTRLGLRPVPAGAAHPLGTLRVQLSPAAGTVPWALRLARTLVRAGEDVVVVAEPGASHEALRELVGAPVVEMRSATVFARDAALPARDDAGRPVLLLPRAFEGHNRADDAMEPAVAAAAFGVEVRRSALFWEGGNLLYDGVRLLVGADTVRENCARLGLGVGDVCALFAAELGEAPLVLGDVALSAFDVEAGRVTESGQAALHIDLDVAALGRFGRNRRPRALVADVAGGLELVPDVLARASLFRGHFYSPREAREQVEALWDARARADHPRLLGYAATLEAAGYRVEGVPDLRIDPREDIFRPANFDLGYCNVLVGLADGRPAVRWLPWGIPALDAAAEAAYRRAGVESVRLGRDPRLAHALMSYSGGLRCATGGLPHAAGERSWSVPLGPHPTTHEPTSASGSAQAGSIWKCPTPVS